MVASQGPGGHGDGIALKKLPEAPHGVRSEGASAPVSSDFGDSVQGLRTVGVPRKAEAPANSLADNMSSRTYLEIEAEGEERSSTQILHAPSTQTVEDDMPVRFPINEDPSGTMDINSGVLWLLFRQLTYQGSFASTFSTVSTKFHMLAVKITEL